MKKTAVLLIGFGGPTKPEEVRPFLASVVGGAKIPEERLTEVFHHYEKVGGVSPFNMITQRQQRALETCLSGKGSALSVGVAYRHSTPNFKDVFEAYKRSGVERVIGFVLASFRSSVSFKKYTDRIEEARQEAGAHAISVEYAEPFMSDPLYIEAQAARIREVWGSWAREKKDSTEVIFTAHSIPTSICQESCRENAGRCYGLQFYEASKRIATLIGAKRWRTAYQSRSGNPRELWLDPDVRDEVAALDPKSTRSVLLVPVGFLCDNVEVLYDLDVEVRAVSEGRGMEYFRAGTVSDHPVFIEMMAAKVLEKFCSPVIK